MKIFRKTCGKALRIGLIFAGVFAWGDSGQIFPTAEAEEPIERLLGLWQNQREEVQTARIRYRLFVRAPKASAETPQGLTPAEVNEFIERRNLVENPDRLADLEGLFPRDFSTNSKSWTDCVFLTDSVRTRNDGNQQSSITDQEFDLRRREIEPPQIEVSWSGTSKIRQTLLTDFRWTVSSAVDAKRLQMISTGSPYWNVHLLPRRDDDRENREQPSSDNQGIRIEVDPTLGTIWHAFRQRTDSNERQIEWRGFGLTDFSRIPDGEPAVAGSQGLVFPRVSMTCDYHDGHLASIALRIIDWAEFNKPIAREEFVLAGRAGDRMVDNRQGHVLAWQLDSNVPDIREEIAMTTVNPRAESTVSYAGIARLLSNRAGLACAGCLFIAVGAWLWRRSFAKKARV